MKKLIYLLLAFAFPLLAVTYGCGSGEEKVTPDSVFSVSYISSLSIQEPERTLALIDSAEQEKLMTDFDVNRLCVRWSITMDSRTMTKRWNMP